MVSLYKYRLEKDDTGKYAVHSLEINVCPICGREFLIIGTRKRGLVANDGEKQTLIIRRLRCKACLKIHHELPDLDIDIRKTGMIHSKCFCPPSGYGNAGRQPERMAGFCKSIALVQS